MLKSTHPMRTHLKVLFNSYSEVFFLKGLWLGIMIMAITLISPHSGLGGMIAVLSAYLMAKFINIDTNYLKSGFYTYNPLLVGLFLGYLYRLSPLTIFFIITAGMLTFLLTHMMSNVFSYYFKLPILTLPFVIVSSVAYLASSQYTNLLVNGHPSHAASTLELHLPIWISGLLKSLGGILCIPNVVVGALLLIFILFFSRIIFLLVIVGYYTGTLITASLVGSVYQAFTNPNHFNYIWIAIAVGGVFLIPSMKSYILAMMAVMISTLLLNSIEVFWANHGVPVFALPFNLVSLTFIYVLGGIQYPLMANYIKATPEDSLDHYFSYTRRFKGSVRSISLPFAGRWMVWQGFDGKWTHQGSNQYAYDFVITDDNNQTYRNQGAQLEDYYAFKKPVLSPVRGRVVKVIDSLPDNQIGQVDRINNWGNLVIIYDQRGFYIELSHFMQYSIKVQEGDWVEQGSMLGLCGNSGYSPQPHMHIQVQATDVIGALTLPFSFIRYVNDKVYNANDTPEENHEIESLPVDKAMNQKMTFILDREIRYQIETKGQKTRELHLTVRSAPDGTFYFDSGKGKLYFGSYQGTFYFYSFDGHDPDLKPFMIGCPSLPLAFRNRLSWTDVIPVGAVTTGFKKAVILFLSSFYHGINKIKVDLSTLNENVIEGTVVSKFLCYKSRTRVDLDDAGIKQIQFEDTIYKRIDHEAVRT